MSAQHDLFATCGRGLAPLVGEELRALGAVNVEERTGGVAFAGSLEVAYRACLWSRVASRVLLPIARFSAPDDKSLYQGVQQVRWSDHLGLEQTLAVEFTQVRSQITHTQFGALRVKDAVVDQFREQTGERPSVDPARPDVRINVHIEDDSATVSIDLSGDSLHKRGWRAANVEAPLKENLAAALLLLGGWPTLSRQGAPLCDPMCGSGTLLIEAALIAMDEAPGLRRDYFGFLGWRGHDAELWRTLVHEAKAIRKPGAPMQIFGWDESPDAIRATQQNLKRTGLIGQITVAQRSLSALEAPGDRPGLLITNPPYGERLGEEVALRPVYQELGDLLKRRFPGWRAGVLTGSPELAKVIGLRPARRHVIWNGPIECRFLEIPISADKPKDDAGPSWRKPRPLGSGAEMFRNRLEKNQKHLAKWAKREGISCYRVYDADLPEYAVAIDRYEDALHVQEYAPPKTIEPETAAGRIDEIMQVAPLALEVAPEDVFLKVRRRQRPERQYTRQSDAGARREVHEGGYRFVVNLSDYLDTGLFLDHRRLRGMIKQLAQGRRFLNLFAYTGSATVYAAAGGARDTTSVDLSNTYLDWAAENLRLNQLDQRKNLLVRDDVLTWLPRQRDTWGLILMTPPTFSNSKKMPDSLDVQRDHVPLIRAAIDRLDTGGELLFSVHSRRFKLDEKALADLDIRNLTSKTVPNDFSRNPRIHATWRMARKGEQ
jgi:23S rRNA (guanine2445-N2)-methyltransferase / 23S rRNA (guanine2069-N7)-methyltransferase